VRSTVKRCRKTCEKEAANVKLKPELVLFVILFLFFAAVGILIGRSTFLDFSAPSIQGTYQFEVLDTRWAFDPIVAADDLRRLSVAGHQDYRRFELLDFLFMSTFAAMLSSAIHPLAKSLRGRWMSALILPAMYFVCDVAEDCAILAALGSTQPSLTALVLARWAGIFKYLFLGATGLALAAAVAVSVQRRFR
jgi:hypothetical protein